MAKPIMAKATAVWLVDNTTLSFKQIADFCELHELEVQGIADGDVAAGVKGFDPIANNQLTQEEIDAAEKDPLHKLKQGKWYEAYGQGSDRWITLPPVSRGGSLLKLFDPNSHKGEYFLVENRAGVNYSMALPSTGLAVWHCDENRLPNWRTAVEIEPACGLINPINYRNYLFTGKQAGFHAQRDLWNYSAHTNLRWHDGNGFSHVRSALLKTGVSIPIVGGRLQLGT